MIIPETIDNLEFKYLYVKSFTWSDTLLQETMQGLPKSGKLYRSIYNKQTLLHSLVITNDTNLIISGLHLTDPMYAYTCEIVEVSLDNILDLKLQEEDLDKLSNWIESKNEDLIKPYNPRKAPNIQTGLIKLQEAINRQENEEAEDMAEATEALYNLYQINSEQFIILTGFIKYLTEHNINSDLDPANHLTLHPQHGQGINIAKALRSIDSYQCDDRRTNGDVEDLFEAMIGLVTEYERKAINNLID